MAKVEKMMEKLKTENLSSYGELVAQRTAHSFALVDKIRLQRAKKKAGKEKEGVAGLLAAGRAKRENIAVDEQLKKDALTVTMKVGEQDNVLAVSLEPAVENFEGLKKEGEAPS